MLHYAPTTDLLAGQVHGTPVTGLCGQVFVPASGSPNPDTETTCPTCTTVHHTLTR